MDSRSFDEDRPLNPKYEQFGQPSKYPRALKLLLFANAILIVTATIYLYIIASTITRSTNATIADCFDGKTICTKLLLSEF